MVKIRVIINFAVIVFAALLVGCTSTIEDVELIFFSGKYFEKSKSTPFTGKVLSRYSNGEIEGERIFKNGLIISSKSFGYEGELVGKSDYEQLKLECLADENISRVIFVRSSEGNNVQYYAIDVILTEGKSLEEIEYKVLKEKVFQEFQQLEYSSELEQKPLFFRVLEGELESFLFEERINKNLY